MKKIRLLVSLVVITLFSMVLVACNSNSAEFKFNSDYISLEVGDTKKSVDVVVDSKLVTYFSIDETIVTIDNEGTIAGKSRGETEVYAIYKNRYYKCHVRVTASTKNPDVYQKDVSTSIIFSIPSLNYDFALKANGVAKYNGKNKLIEYNENSKFQYKINLLDTPVSKDDILTASSQAKQNVAFINLVLSFMAVDSTSDELKKFQQVIKEFYDEIAELEGEALDNKIKEINDITIYFYISSNYLAFGIFSKQELKAYAFSNSENGIISKLPNIINTIKQLATAGIDLQKVDYIETFKSLTGDLLTEATRKELKKYQTLVSILVYIILGDLQINKTTVDEATKTERLTFTVLEDGIKKINDEMQADTRLEALSISSALASIDVTKNLDTNYNYIKKAVLNITNDEFGINGKVNVDITDATIINEDNPYDLESKHSEFEKTLTKESA